MSETTTSDSRLAETDGVLSRLGNLYVSPSEAFRHIAARPRWLAAFLLLAVVHVAFAAVWTPRMDPHQMVRTKLEESGMMERIPPEKLAGILDQQAKIVKVMSWVSGVTVVPLVNVILAAVFLFVFRFVFAGELSFRQSLGVVGWSFLAVALVALPLTLAIMQLKGDWNIDPLTAIQASPAALLDKGAVAKPLYRLAVSLDLRSLWAVGLLSAGYAAALRRPFSTGVLGVGTLWLVYVVGNVALSAVF